MSDTWRVIDDQGKQWDVTVTEDAVSFTGRWVVQLLAHVGERPSRYHGANSIRSCVAWKAGISNIAVREVLAPGEESRAERDAKWSAQCELMRDISRDTVAATNANADHAISKLRDDVARLRKTVSVLYAHASGDNADGIDEAMEHGEKIARGSAR